MNADLIGNYTPVIIGQALQYFITHGDFGTVFLPENPNISVPLGNLLVLAKQGYVFRDTILALLNIYVKVHNLKNGENIHSDNFMMEIFGGVIPAVNYEYSPNRRTVRLSMDVAVERGIIPTPLNTYQLLSILDPPGEFNSFGGELGFHPENIKPVYLNKIADLNYYSENQLDDPRFAEVKRALTNNDILNELRNENTIVNNALTQLKNALQNPNYIQINEQKQSRSAEAFALFLRTLHELGHSDDEMREYIRDNLEKSLQRY